MKIALVALTLNKGGAQRMLVELAHGLSYRGHEVVFVMPLQAIIEYSLNVPIIRSKNNYTILSSDIPESDVIVSNYYTTVDECERASQSGKGMHVRISLCYEPVFLPQQEVSFKTYLKSKNLIVISNWQKQLINLIHGIEGEIVPVGISDSFCNLGMRPDKKSLEISGILRVPEGGYSWQREQEYLLEVFTLIKLKYPEITINLISPPHEFQNSPVLNHLHAIRYFNSFIPINDQQLNGILNKTDIFVSTSIYDTADLPGLEAMKCGASLVTVYSGGNMEYCRHGENCLLSYRHENKVLQHVLSLIENPSLRSKLAKEGEKEAAKWTWNRSVSLFEKAIQTFKNRK